MRIEKNLKITSGEASLLILALQHLERDNWPIQWMKEQKRLLKRLDKIFWQIRNEKNKRKLKK